MRRYVFETTCVNASHDDIVSMQRDARPASLRAMRTACEGFAEWERAMGYDRRLPLSRDRCVSYGRGTFRGRPCLFATHSRIDHIWTRSA